MKRNNIIAAAVSVSTAVVLSVTGCSSGSAASTDKSSAPSSSAPQENQVQQKLVSLAKDEPYEDKDVTGLRLESKLVDGVTNTHLKFEVTNSTSDVCDYTIVVDLDSDAVTGREISVEDVPPGQTVTYDEEVDAADGNVIPLQIDRFSQDEGWDSDDLGTFTYELRQDGSGLVLDWSMTNYAEETSAYEVKYRVKSVDSGSYGKVVHESTLKTKALDPGSVNGEYGPDEPGTHEPGGIETGSVTIPSSNVPAGVTVGDDGEVLGVVVEILDQDRIRYEE